MVDLEPHDFEEVHGEQGERAREGNEEDDPGESMPDLFLHQVLGHYGVAEPACGCDGEDETQGRVKRADRGQVLESVRDAHQARQWVRINMQSE